MTQQRRLLAQLECLELQVNQEMCRNETSVASNLQWDTVINEIELFK